jgi:hypothetical protein
MAEKNSKLGGAAVPAPSLEAPGVPAPRVLPQGLRISEWIRRIPSNSPAWPEAYVGTELAVCQFDLDWLSIASPGRPDRERIAAARRLAAQMRHAPKLRAEERLASIFLAIGAMTTRFPRTDLSRNGRPRKAAPWAPTAYQWSSVVDVLLPRYFRAEIDECLNPGGARRYERTYGVDPTSFFAGSQTESRWDAEAGQQELRAHDSYYPSTPALLFASFAKRGQLDALVAAFDWFERAQGWSPFEPPIYRKPFTWEREPDVLRKPSLLFREALKLKMRGGRLTNPPLTKTVRKRVRADIAWRVSSASGNAGTHITPGTPVHDDAGYPQRPLALRMEAAALRGIANAKRSSLSPDDFASAMERAATYETYASRQAERIRRTRPDRDDCKDPAYGKFPPLPPHPDNTAWVADWRKRKTMQTAQLDRIEEKIDLITSTMGLDPVQEAERILTESVHSKGVLKVELGDPPKRADGG